MVVLSEATINDISRIREIIYESITTEYADIYPKEKLNVLRNPAEETVRELILKRRYSAHIVTYENQTIGFSCVDLRFGILRALYICPTHISQGHGGNVLTKCESLAKGNCEGLSVTAIPESKGFYQKYGYRIVQTTDMNCNSVDLKSVILVKPFHSSYEVPDFIL